MAALALASLLLSTLLAQPAGGRPVHLGTSGEGRPLTGYWLGTGPDTLIVVGGIHGRPEANSSALVWQLLDYFESGGSALPPRLQLLFVPEANPDGLANGSRELADGVDPNRNFPTADWTPGTYGPGRWLPDGGGGWPLSEPETIALAQMIERIHPAAVLSYHSAAAIATGGASAQSSGLLDVYAEVSGYPPRQFAAYPVTGDFAQWCDEIGIPTIEVELSDHFDSELDRNRVAVQAVLDQLMANTAGSDPSY
jgi:murein peptide amidase A